MTFCFHGKLRWWEDYYQRRFSTVPYDQEWECDDCGATVEVTVP